MRRQVVEGQTCEVFGYPGFHGNSKRIAKMDLDHEYSLQQNRLLLLFSSEFLMAHLKDSYA
jgi:hypothetical protein